MEKIILKPLPPGTPKKVRLPPLSELHPAYAMDSRNKKAYLSVLFDTLPIELDNKILHEAYKPMGWRLGGGLFANADSVYLDTRKLTRARDLAIQQYCGDDIERFRNEAGKALKDYEDRQETRRMNRPAIPKAPTGGAWLTGKPKKAILFLDCACILRNTGRPDFYSFIDAIAQELKIQPAIVELVKAHASVPDDRDLYHKACADIAALVKPKPAKKKTAAKKAADKKVAAKKAAARNIAAWRTSQDSLP